MMSDAERHLIINIELLYDKWAREWAERVRNNTQPTREDERVHILELKKIITDHVHVYYMDEFLKNYLK